VAPLISTTIALHRPEAVALVAAASAAARDTLGPQRYSSSSVSIAAVTGEHSRLADPSARDAWSAFADQFVLDVTGLRDQPSVYPDMTAAEWKVLVTALYVHALWPTPFWMGPQSRCRMSLAHRICVRRGRPTRTV